MTKTTSGRDRIDTFARAVGWLACTALVACNPGAPSSHEDHTAQLTTERQDALNQHLASTRAHLASAGQPQAVTAQSGPALTGIIGWSGKYAGSPEIGLADSQAREFEASVEQLTGYNPFRYRTAAGPVAVVRGVQPALQQQIAAAPSHREFIALVMPTLPAQPAIRQLITKAGADVLGMASRHTYVVRTTADTLRRLIAEPMIYWIGQVPWDKKLDPLLVTQQGIAGAQPALSPDRSIAQPDHAMVTLYDNADEAVLLPAIERLGATIEDYDSQIATFHITGTDAKVTEQLSRMQEVSFVSARRLDQPMLETSLDLSGNHDYVRDVYSYGSSTTIGMIDSGFELQHDAFKGNSVNPILYARGWNVSGEGSVWDDNPTRHGTHVAGILLSRWYNVNLDGAAPRSGGDANHRFRVVRTGKDSETQYFYNTDQAMDILASDNGAEVINCSWGNSSNTGTNADAIKADSIVWNNGQTYVFSAGNTGTDPGSIGSPAAAKNVIAVGNVNNGTLALESDSSEGPTNDNRQKPDIYAPGRWVTSANADNLNGSVNFGGTSMSAPHVTGFLATLLDHYPNFRRRPALAKAYLMASATRKTWLPQRTGVLNSYEAHFATSTTGGKWGWRDTDPTPYAYTYWDITIPSGVDEMYIILTWIEPPSAVGAANAVLNDVDLWVDYNKDDGTYGEWASVSVADNVEWVRITNPPAGDYRIKARNYSVSTDYRPAFGLLYRK